MISIPIEVSSKISIGREWTMLDTICYLDVVKENEVFATQFLSDEWNGTILDLLNMEHYTDQDKLEVFLTERFCSQVVLRLFMVNCSRLALRMLKTEHRVLSSACDIAELFAHGNSTAEEVQRAIEEVHAEVAKTALAVSSARATPYASLTTNSAFYYGTAYALCCYLIATAVTEAEVTKAVFYMLKNEATRVSVAVTNSVTAAADGTTANLAFGAKEYATTMVSAAKAAYAAGGCDIADPQYVSLARKALELRSLSLNTFHPNSIAIADRERKSQVELLKSLILQFMS